MLLLLLVSLLASLLAGTQGLPASNLTGRLSRQDYQFLQSLPRVRSSTQMPGFKYIYVDSVGGTSYQVNPSIYQLEIAGSQRTSYEAIQAAAQYVGKMTRYMPLNIFINLCTQASVGIFTAAEKLTVYPEYSNLANGNCGSSCTGSCQHTCTFDGRKYEDIAGVGGARAVILDDNVLCSPQDPYNHQENILAHEFTHTIQQYALTPTDQAHITQAYNAAKQAQTWNLNSYAMSDDREYFAEAATVFFGVNMYSSLNTGGMNVCGVSGFCGGEMQARQNLWARDPRLYSILSYVFTDNRPSYYSSLTVCPAFTAVG
ncbi:uncharacterized protein LOC131936572 [Physella acuta]|uniref:uncharacterized protein LOC131936572 n=1 Tax=Physella acuta TaxID=109671 RepID=UPI0027DD2A59|nr:uncharacterized protein LOC131936572 [Physella acuta]